MSYKSLPGAFLFQTLVGALCIVSISLFGPKWIATLAVLSLRPLLLERIRSLPDQKRWQFYYRIMKISLVCTALTIIFVYISFEVFPHAVPIKQLWLLMVLPYFIFIHGLIGLMLSVKNDQTNIS